MHTFPKSISVVRNANRVWTRVAVSISFDDNHYNTSAPEYETKWCLEFKLVQFWIEKEAKTFVAPISQVDIFYLRWKSIFYQLVPVGNMHLHKTYFHVSEKT